MSQEHDETLKNDGQLENTESTLDTQEPDLYQDDPNNEDGEKEQQGEELSKEDHPDLDTETLNMMNDDEFTEYLESGKLPDSVVAKKQGKGQEGEDGNRNLSDPDVDESSSGLGSNRNKPDGSGNIEDANKQTTTKSNEAVQNKGQESTKGKKNEVPKGQEEVNYKSVYDKIFSPFKANGKDIKPETVDDVISLMQQGANYTKKMQAMAPMRKIFESINKAGITNDDLNFLIDVYKGNQDAIKTLLSKHKVDPMELDMDSTNYQAGNNMATDEDVEYSDALDDIQSSIPKIQEIINTRWDTKSKKEILSKPEYIRALHEEIQYGRFDVAQERLEIAKTFGRYKGVSDLEAYQDIVAQMIKEHDEQSGKKPVTTTKTTPNTPTTKKPDPNKAKAAPTSAKATSNSHSNQLNAEDIFNMSDADFERLAAHRLVS